MKRYTVVFEQSAQSDVRESYDWGGDSADGSWSLSCSLYDQGS